jgi:hypothetical protein
MPTAKPVASPRKARLLSIKRMIILLHIRPALALLKLESLIFQEHDSPCLQSLVFMSGAGNAVFTALTGKLPLNVIAGLLIL